MSQAGIIDVVGNYPAIPTQFDGNTGFAIPAFNVLDVVGNTSQGVSVAGDGVSTLTITVADATAISKGVAQFDSGDFTVVAGVVTLNGGGGGAVMSVTGTADRITSSGGANPVIDIAGTYVGQASITTLGTIATGVWNGSVIPLAYGGTNANLTANTGGVFYSTSTAGAILAGTATAGQHLQSGATAAPSWTTATYPSTATTTGTILRANGTNWVATTATYPTTTTANQLLYSSSANVIGEVTAGTNNSILMGNTGAAPAFTTTGTPYVTGISFDAGTTTLSNYSTGTFLSTFVATSINITYNSQVSTWTRIGNQVSVSIKCWCNTATNGGTGTLTIAGLPFTSRNTSNLNNVFPIQSNFDMAATVSLVMVNQPNTTSLTFSSMTTNGGTISNAKAIANNRFIDTSGVFYI